VVPPAVLAGLVALVGVWPELALEFVVQDAAAATEIAGEAVEVHAEIPTELSGPAVMSIITVGTGVGLFPVYDRVWAGIDAVYEGGRALHPEHVYRESLHATERASVRLDELVHSGLIRTYVWWVLTAACTITLVGYAATGASPALTSLDVPLAMGLVLGVAVLAALAVTVTPSHVTGVLTLGILGFMVAIFYILASGPDLALTQLVVETLLLVIFLIVIEEMPAFYIDKELGVLLRDAALSALVGATAFVSVLVATPTDVDLTETARYYVDNAVKEGGGANIVNVILTDFRALDTLGESVVIVVAALSVLVMLTMRNRGETQ
jgi:multicomponent Na+:H+ antiporter subunit A